MSEMDTYEPKYHVASVCEVVRTAMVTPHMRRITLHSAALEGLKDHWRSEMLLRLYFPPKGHSSPPEPYLTPGGELEFKTTAENAVSPFSAFSEDPLVRAFTARRFRPDTLELEVDFVLHEAPGLASDWARYAAVGARIGVVEFALPRGHRPVTAHQADVYLLFADEAALPAAQTNLEAFAPGMKVIAFFEVANQLEEQAINTKADLSLTWLHRGDAEPGTSGLLLQALRELAWPEGKVFVWACGEMKTITQIRKFVIEERGIRKDDCKCQAYWRRGKTEVQRMARMTDLTLAAAESDPTALLSSFEEIGMNIEDPTLFDESAQIEVAQSEIGEQHIPTVVEANKLTPLHDTWNITMKTPLGIQKATLHLSTMGGKLTGRMESRVGSSDLSDGTIAGDMLTWKVGIKFPRRMTFEFSGKVEEDSITGTVKLASLGNATFEGTRG